MSPEESPLVPGRFAAGTRLAEQSGARAAARRPKPLRQSRLQPYRYLRHFSLLSLLYKYEENFIH